jgi:hypothetical protein
MIAPGVYLGRSVRFASLALGLFAPFAASAQGRIDPSLPSAPLSYSRKFLMTPGIDTVKDPRAVLPPLTVKEKYRLFWLRTADISMPLEAAFLAGFSQAMGNQPRYGTDSGAYAARFGSYAASMATCRFFEDALLPSVFKQDPRYFRKGEGSVKSRLLYALKEEWVTRSDAGGSAFNYSEILGAGMSTALGDAWWPRRRVKSGGLTLNATMERYAAKLGFTAMRNVAHEFGRFHENNRVVASEAPAP